MSKDRPSRSIERIKQRQAAHRHQQRRRSTELEQQRLSERIKQVAPPEENQRLIDGIIRREDMGEEHDDYSNAVFTNVPKSEQGGETP